MNLCGRNESVNLPPAAAEDRHLGGKNSGLGSAQVSSVRA